MDDSIMNLHDPNNIESETVEKKKLPSSLLDANFWFEMNKNDVESSFDRLNSSAEKFEKLILWLWSIYTSIIGLGATGVTLFTQIKYPVWAIGFMAIPSIILPIAYWYSINAQTSQVMEIEDRNSPKKIEKAFLIARQAKRDSLDISKHIAFIGCIFISIVIVIASTAKESTIPQLEVNLVDNKDITYTYKGTYKYVSIYLNEKKYQSFVIEKETFTGNIPLSPEQFNEANEIIVMLEYEDKEKIYRIGQKLKKKEKK